MKKLYASIVIVLLVSLRLSAESLTQLEGSFKTGPAIILIATLLTLFLSGFSSAPRTRLIIMLPAGKFRKLVPGWLLPPTG